MELVVQVDNRDANANLKATNVTISELERRAVSSAKAASGSFDGMTNSFTRSRDEIYEGRVAAQLLGRELGVQLPRSVARFLAQSALIGPALSAAFEISIFAAMGVALYEGAKKLYNWTQGTKDAEEATKRHKEEQEKLNKSLEDYGTFLDRMAKLRQEGATVGLTGAAKTASDIADLQKKVNTAQIEWEGLKSSLNRVQVLPLDAAAAMKAAFDSTSLLAKAAKEYEEKRDQIQKKEWSYLELKGQLENAILELKKQQTDEMDKQIEKEMELNRQMISRYRTREWQMAEDLQKLVGSAETAGAVLGQLPAARALPPIIDPEQVAHLVDAIKLTADLKNQNQSLAEQILRRRGDIMGAAQIEIDVLEQQKKLYADNSDAIAAITEREKLIVTQANFEIAEDAKRQFDRTASAIEGFFQRVFLTAKSFADVWKQLWTQAVGYVVTQLSKMTAGLIMGGYRAPMAAGGPAGGGGSGGILGALSGMIPIWGGGGGIGGLLGTPGFNPNAAAGGSAMGRPGGAGGGGLFSGLLGGGAGSLAGLKSFVGLGTSHGAELQATLMTGGARSFSATLGHILTSNAAAMGGAMLAMYGLQRGGLSGLGMTTAGGALIGARFGGPLGAAIGAGIGALAGTIRLFFKGATEKAKEKIKATYGVDVTDKGVLQQIVDIAKQGFGGNLDMAIRSAQVADLIRLYAMTTGQGTGGLARPMTPSTLVQSGGALYQAPTYYGGAILPSLSGSVRSGVAAGAAGGIVIVNQLTIPGARKFFEEETIEIISKSPRPVQGASFRALGSSFLRRESIAMQISPGTLTS
jgi:hypothetical protein